MLTSLWAGDWWSALPNAQSKHQLTPHQEGAWFLFCHFLCIHRLWNLFRLKPCANSIEGAWSKTEMSFDEYVCCIPASSQASSWYACFLHWYACDYPCYFLKFQLPANLHPGELHMMALLVGSLPPIWETQMNFFAWVLVCFGSGCLAHLESEPADAVLQHLSCSKIRRNKM